MKKLLLWLLLIAAVVFGCVVGYWVYEGRATDEATPVSAADTRAVDALTRQELAAFESDADGWAGMEAYTHWRRAVFPIGEYDAMPVNFRRALVKVFVDNKYLQPDKDTEIHRLTRIKDRAPKVFTFGNYAGREDGGHNPDMGVLLESSDFASSALLVLSPKGDLLYWKKYPDSLPVITSFRKGAKIYMGNDLLEPAPEDGMILETDDRKWVVIYDRRSKTFKDHYQLTEADVKERQQAAAAPTEGDGEECEECECESTAEECSASP